MSRPAAVFALGLILAPVAISAEPDAAAYHEYRGLLFEGFGKHMKAMSMVVKGKIDRPSTDFVAHASALAEGAALIPSLFPEGTGPDKVKTEALPAIWTDAAGFQKAAETLQAEATKLVEIAKGGDMAATKAQFGAVGKSCGGCHETFRLDE